VDDNTFFLSYTGAMKTPVCLQTTKQVIDHYGGNEPFANLFETTHQCVSNWKTKKKFPANYYLWMRVLVTDEVLIPDTLWAMRYPKRKRKKR
jgi:hypothetical protein